MFQANLSRRRFLADSTMLSAMLAGGALLGKSVNAGEKKSVQDRFQICTFVKFLQDLSYDELGKEISKIGLKGVEFAVRQHGKILPENSEAELPKAVEALKKHGVEITIMTTDFLRADQPHVEKTLRLAAQLGIKQYRLGYYRYDLSKPVLQQLRSFIPIAKELAALNKEIGIQGIYQNHAGENYVGAAIWDLQQIVDGIPKEALGIAFDIRHAAVELGASWPTAWNLVQPHLASVYVKDAAWKNKKAVNVPLADPDGIVKPGFFKMLKESDFSGSLSLHIEHLERAPAQAQLEAIAHDLKTLNRLLAD